MIARDDVTRAVREYIDANFLYMRPGLTYSDSESLLRRGVIDSLGVMELVGFVEDQWKVEVPPQDVTQQHFGTLEGIAAYVVGRRNGG